MSIELSDEEEVVGISSNKVIDCANVVVISFVVALGDVNLPNNASFSDTLAPNPDDDGGRSILLSSFILILSLSKFESVVVISSIFKHCHLLTLKMNHHSLVVAMMMMFVDSTYSHGHYISLIMPHYYVVTI